MAKNKMYQDKEGNAVRDIPCAVLDEGVYVLTADFSNPFVDRRTSNDFWTTETVPAGTRFEVKHTQETYQKDTPAEWTADIITLHVAKQNGWWATSSPMRAISKGQSLHEHAALTAMLSIMLRRVDSDEMTFSERREAFAREHYKSRGYDLDNVTLEETVAVLVRSGKLTEREVFDAMVVANDKYWAKERLDFVMSVLDLDDTPEGRAKATEKLADPEFVAKVEKAGY